MSQANALPEPEVEEIEITVLMPCLNEAETVATCVRKARECLERHGYRGEVLVADNGSTDGSQALATGEGARVVPVAERGYGAALRGGIAAARGRYVIMADADDSYDFTALEPFVEKLREGYHLVMGNRFRGGIKPGAMPRLHYWVGNPVLTGIGRLFFRSPIGDFHCGLRGFDRAAIQHLDLKTQGMEFASEMVVMSTLHGLRVAEVPTTLSPDGRSRPPHLRSFRDGWRHLRFLLMFSPRWLFLYPGAAMMLVGAALGLWLLPAPRTVGGVTLDVHTLVYASALVLVGYQTVLFAVLAKTFAIANGLLPRDARIDRLYKTITLEVGLISAALMLIGGFGGTGFAVWSWASSSFGPQAPEQLLRVVVPSALLLALGTQTAFSSFFLSLLGLERRVASAAERA